MLHLLWNLFSLGVFVFFVVICFRATKFVYGKMGLFSSVIFVLGLLSFSGNSNHKGGNQGTNSNRVWKFASEDSLGTNMNSTLNIDLEKTWVSKYYLYISYGKDKQGQTNIPINAFSATTGLVGGILWKPTVIGVNRTSDNHKFEYDVLGVEEWKILGRTVYVQPKKYHGIAWIK